MRGRDPFWIVVAAIAVLAVAAVAAPSGARTRTTFEQTIQDRDRDNQLEPAPGEDYLYRDNLGINTRPGVDPREVSRIFFAHFTDNHFVDEESPARVEWLDKFDGPFTSAYRPHEGLMPQAANEMMEQVRNTISPATEAHLRLAMQTGDNTDNTQCNETRWMIDTFDGDQFIDPNSGIEGDIEAPGESELCDTTVGGIDPAPSDPPASPACNVPDNGSIYDGVRGDQEYYEPDLSDAEPESPPFTNASSVDGNGYSPYPQENLAEAGRNSEVRDFPGLYERMNHPFRAVGLDIPWYSVFGNHDALLQGNQPRRLEFETIALGCVKVKGPSAGTVAFIQERLADGEITPEEGDEILDQAMSEVGGSTQIVPPDPRRRPLRKSEYIAEHFATTGEPVGHGYTPENVATGMGNYAFDPLSDDPDNPSGLRFVALDSIAENGGDGGNIDREQFEWLHEQLVEADQERQVVVVFVHHSLRTMDQAGAHPVFTPGDQGGNQNPVVHQGLTAVPNLPLDTPPDPCPIKGTPPGNNVLPPPPGETLRCLLLRHKSVIALVNGHEHANRIDPWARDRDDPDEQENQVDGGFWEINTAAHIDWPAQSRVLDLVDNGDCSLSIFTTMIDHAGAPMPGGAPPSDGHGHAGEAPTRMASIARELSFNDPDARNGQDDEPVQRGDARGGHDDRNAELVVKHPFCGG